MEDVNVVKFHKTLGGTRLGGTRLRLPQSKSASDYLADTILYLPLRSQARYSLAPCQAQTCAWLESWDSYRKVDWINEIEYPELTYYETQRFLSEKFISA